MYSLARFSLLEMTECSAVLRQLGEQSRSLRDVAARAVDYRTLLSAIRIRARVIAFWFDASRRYPMVGSTRRFSGWPEKSWGVSLRLLDLKCFTLMATAGEEPDWNHVELSHRYRVIPMVNADFVKQFPMFSQLLHQFGSVHGV